MTRKPRDSRATSYVVPRLGRSGLGNELFAISRALEIAAGTTRRFVPPHWFIPRIGPYVRRDYDKRNYWTIFKFPRLVDIPILFRVLLGQGTDFQVPGAANAPIITTKGVGDHFSDLPLNGRDVRVQLQALVRANALSAPRPKPYVAIHVRLGDFSLPTTVDGATTRNNQRTSMGWFVERVSEVRRKIGLIDIVVASDGTDDELSALLSLENTSRSLGKNAMDDIYMLSRSAGIVGSRSTFTAWGSYLGMVPTVVGPFANAYKPHVKVWEVGGTDASEWINEVIRRMARPTQ